MGVEEGLCYGLRAMKAQTAKGREGSLVIFQPGEVNSKT